jgi:hypothetical protein
LDSGAHTGGLPAATRSLANHSDKGVNKLETVKCEAFRSDLRSLLNQHLVALPSHQEEVVRLSFLEEKVSENFQPSPRIHLAP